MKITPLHTLAILILLSAGSCSKHSDNPPTTIIDPYTYNFSLSRTSLNLGMKTGATDTFRIISTLGWTIKFSDGADKWLSVDSLKGGPGTTTVRLTVNSDNLSPVPNSAKVTVRADYDQIKPIDLQVNQQ